MMSRRSLSFSTSLVLAALAPACSSNSSTDGGNRNDVTTVVDAGDVTTPSDIVATDTPPGTDGGTDVVTADTAPPTPHAVTQWHGDLQRTGANRAETHLTQAAVMGGSFHRDTAFMPTFDDVIYAQPLYLGGQTIGGATHDVLFVATLNNSVYAVDALTGASLWHVNLGTPFPFAMQPCGNIGITQRDGTRVGNTGILGTPVIDAASGTLYAVSYSNATGQPVFSINALDVTTGNQRTGYPAAINPPVSNGSHWTPITQQQRGALTFVDGKVYVPFGGLYGDCGTYHGWVVGIDAVNPTAQAAVATGGIESGIWGPGGIAADGAGHVFAVTGNGRNAASMGDYVFRLGTGTTGPTWSGTANDYFQPSDWATLDSGDVDLGTIQPLILPDHSGSSTPHLVFTGGKNGVGYLINRDNLGGLSGTMGNPSGDGVNGEGVYSDQVFSGGSWGGAAAWSNGTDIYAFLAGHGGQPGTCPGNGGIVALHLTLTGGHSSFEVAFCTASAGDPAAPIVTSNGNQDGVLWVVDAGRPHLQAYALPSGAMLYQSGGADALPSAQHWTAPIAVDGRVYVTGPNAVYLYRLM